MSRKSFRRPIDERICRTRTRATGALWDGALFLAAAGCLTGAALTFGAALVTLLVDLALAAFLIVDFAFVFFLVDAAAFFVVFFAAFLAVLPLASPIDLAGIHYLLHTTLARPVVQVSDRDSKPTGN